MDPIKINVNVQIGVTEELYSLLSLLTKHTPAPAVAAVPAESKPAEEAPAAAVEVSNKEEAPAAAPAAEPAAEAAPEPEAPAEEKEYTEVDVRAAMDRTRRRFEGEDYKDNTSSELYKKYHRALTAQFKQIASVLGSDKPSALPSSELRGSFIRQCDELEIGEDGSIVTKCPF